jgi:hypothetical protein
MSSSRLPHTSSSLPPDATNSFELHTIRPPNEPSFNHSAEPEDADEDEDERLLRRPSTDSAKSYELYTPDEDRAVVRRLDRRLVAFMALLYMLSFLDRSSEYFFFLDVICVVEMMSGGDICVMVSFCGGRCEMGFG